MAAPLTLLSPSTPALLSVLASVPALMVLSRQFALVRYYTRLALFLTGLATCSVWGVVVSIAYGCMGRRADSNWRVARSFHWLVAPLVGFRFSVEGEEYLDDNKPAVVIGNHQTMIDILCAFFGWMGPPTAADGKSQTSAGSSPRGAASWPSERCSTCPCSASS